MRSGTGVRRSIRANTTRLIAFASSPVGTTTFSPGPTVVELDRDPPRVVGADRVVVPDAEVDRLARS
jgi:hypothetical protein